MRQIKFRVWNYNDKKFIINENVRTTIQMVEFFRYSTGAIMQQFTGLYDKHNKEIYEGDIVKFDDGEIAEVVFFCGAFMPKLEKGSGISIQYNAKPIWQDGEVIGNITENSELLGGKNE